MKGKYAELRNSKENSFSGETYDRGTQCAHECLTKSLLGPVKYKWYWLKNNTSAIQHPHRVEEFDRREITFFLPYLGNMWNVCSTVDFHDSSHLKTFLKLVLFLPPYLLLFYHFFLLFSFGPISTTVIRVSC